MPYLMGIAMGAGFYAGSDVSVFPNAQMFYPAAGVMLALLVTKKEDNMLPRKFFVCFLAVTVLMLACSLASVLAPALPAGALISNLVMMRAARWQHGCAILPMARPGARFMACALPKRAAQTLL